VIRAALILLALTGPAGAASLEQFRDSLHCWAYPNLCRAPIPTPAPRPPEAPAEPVQAPPVAPPPVPAVVPPPPVATPQAVPAPVVNPLPMRERVHVTPPKQAKAKPRVKTKAVPQKAKRKRVAMPSWWSCAEARQKAAGKSRAQMAVLQAMGRVAGYTLTTEQEAVAKRCLGIS
jgi:outer membrane biosynthesis protein TonB